MDSPASSSSQPVTPAVKDEKKPIKLHSPYGASALSFHWHKDYEKNGCMDIYDNIRQIFVLIPEVKEKLEKNELFQNSNIMSYEWIKAVAKKFNKVAQAYFKEHSKNGEPIKEDYASPDLLKAICTRSYNRAVDDEKKLNRHYEAFSSQTYGETSYERLRSIIEEIGVNESDIFVDLGSGVGQLVIQMAGIGQIKRACGIEIADLPSKFASKLEHEFKAMMKWFGRKYRPFQIHHGDFLDDKFRQLITNEATIIFINNYAFQADLESNIKNKLLAELKHGTKIISTKPYAPVNKKSQITQRSLGEIASILDVTELKQCPNPCSWTSNNVPYYFHVINRTKLEAFFEMQKNPSLRSGTPSSSQTSSREASCAPSRNGMVKDKNGDAYGPTTRRKWNQLVTEMEQSKRPNEPETPKENYQTPPQFRSPTPLIDAAKTRAANIADTIASVAEGTADSFKEFASPVKKRPRKEPADGKITVRGRPRKNTQPQEKKARISQDAREGLDIMHQMSTEASIRSNENFLDPSFVLTDVKGGLNFTDSSMDTTEPVATGHGDLDKKLDKLFGEIRQCFVKFFKTTKIPYETDDVTAAEITDEGVKLFKASIAALGMDIDQPREKLSMIKKFVGRYNRVHDLIGTLELEMAAMEQDTQDIIGRYTRDMRNKMALPPPEPAPTPAMASTRVIEDFAQPTAPVFNHTVPTTASIQSTLRTLQQSFSGSSDPNASIDQALINTIAQSLVQNPSLLNSSLFGQNGNLLQSLTETAAALPQSQQPSTSSLLNPYLNLPAADLLNLAKSGNLQSALSDPTSALNIHTNNALYTNDTSRASTTAPPVVPTPSETTTTAMTAAPAPVITSLPSTSKESTQALSATTASSTEPSVNGTSKKPRSRSIRVPSNKKTAPPKNPDDPVKQEEIDQRIKNIVQIALEVDKSAKSQAEKDRKARNSEKRAKEKLSNGAPGVSVTDPNAFEQHKPEGSSEPVTTVDESANRKASKSDKKNKTFPTMSMASPNSQSKKRLSTDAPSLPASSLAISIAAAAPVTSGLISTTMTRPIIPASNSILASSPLYPMQQLLTPTSSVPTSSNTVFPMDAAQQNDFLNLLNQATVKETDPMQMLLRNMNGINGTQHILNLISGFSGGYQAAVSSTPTVINNNNTDALQEIMNQFQLRRNLPVPSSVPLPSENDGRSVNSQPQQSDVGQF